MSSMPILIDAAGLRVLVVGGGTVATRKARQFASSGALVRVVAPELGAEMEQVVVEHGLLVSRRPYAGGDIADAQLVIAATNDRSVNDTIAREANAEHRLVNVTDLSDGGTFAVMAAHRRGGLTVGVSAGGVPAAAVRIRDAIGERFDARYADALNALTALRRELIAGGNASEWRRRSAELVDDEFCDTVEQGALGQRIAKWP